MFNIVDITRAICRQPRHFNEEGDWGTYDDDTPANEAKLHPNQLLIADAPDLLAEVKRLREQLLQGVMYMHMTSTQTKDGRIYNAKKFERQVREMIE